MHQTFENLVPLYNKGFPMLCNLLHYGANGNIILIIIGICSLISCSIFIERLFHMKKSETNTNKLIIQLRKSIKEGNIVESIKTCESTGGAISNIIKAGLLKYDKKRANIEQAMEISGLVEIAKLEKNAKILSIIAHISPMIGLLGTVLGFIQAFSEMRLSGLVDMSATRIGEALEYALVTTAAGLVVAIPTLVAYNYLVSRIEGFILEIQTTASEIVDILTVKQDEVITDYR